MGTVDVGLDSHILVVGLHRLDVVDLRIAGDLQRMLELVRQHRQLRSEWQRAADGDANVTDVADGRDEIETARETLRHE